MHYTDSASNPIASQKRQRAAAISYAFMSNAKRVRDYISTQRKKITYALICRCAKSLLLSRAQVCDALASLGMR